MNRPPLVPPLKCQGIKTKLVSDIRQLAKNHDFDRWVEPFCGSCVVALNVQPPKALLCDSNVHIIRFYSDIQSGHVTPECARLFLIEQGKLLSSRGEDHYYEMRERFNKNPSSLDFLFLNRSCFNGVMRFNQRGLFNVPFCRKNNRFTQSYITKIINQIRSISQVIVNSDWCFKVADFRETITEVSKRDFAYIDPPYAGRHVDYFNSWSDEDENQLAGLLKNRPCKFVLSTWHSNEFRSNHLVQENWEDEQFHIIKKTHFYHVGATEELRHPMIEALIMNFSPGRHEQARKEDAQQLPLLAG